jgi:hypothetical protein
MEESILAFLGVDTADNRNRQLSFEKKSEKILLPKEKISINLALFLWTVS